MTDVATRPSTGEWHTFEQDFRRLTPQLLAFARSLTGSADKADDLLQDTLLKAWVARDSFTEGTNLKAWTFMIMRNQFYSEKRRSWRESQLDQAVAERTLTTGGMPQAEAEHDWRALRLYLLYLPDEQRDAAIAVGYLQLGYDEAAEVLGTVTGTVKSRVSRARRALDALMEGPPPRAEDVDLDALIHATDGVPKSHPYYAIAEAYEELYRELAPPTPYGRRKTVRCGSVQPASTTLEKAWLDLVSSGSLDGGGETLEDLLMFEDGE